MQCASNPRRCEAWTEDHVNNERASLSCVRPPRTNSIRAVGLLLRLCMFMSWPLGATVLPILSLAPVASVARSKASTCYFVFFFRDCFADVARGCSRSWPHFGKATLTSLPPFSCHPVLLPLPLLRVVSCFAGSRYGRSTKSRSTR